MSIFRNLTKGVLLTVFMGAVLPSGGEDFSGQLDQLRALGRLTGAPEMIEAEGYENTDQLKAVFFEALPYEGKPTRVFAWLGMPENAGKKVPGVVLVHGGGGTAFKEWVTRWNERGFAAISIAVEGQTDRKSKVEGETIPTGWTRHEWAGPWRTGIYHDSGKPFEDQWMVHAVADTILANSLLRSIPGVDADRVGIMGISWGGVITSTTIGLDPRFAFAIPTYGCGHLFNAQNQYGKSLEKNPVYRQVLDPVLHLERAKMPVLWFSWPEDSHFPMESVMASHDAAGGPQALSLVPKMGHGHGSGWNRMESYAFARSVVEHGKPWYRLETSLVEGGQVEAVFTADRSFDAATLVYSMDSGFTGKREWQEVPAALEQRDAHWVVSAKVPGGATACFLNAKAGPLVATSRYMDVP